MKDGSESPPPADYRVIQGHMRLGRYLDPYSAQMGMDRARHDYQSWWWGIAVLAGTALAVWGSALVPLAVVVGMWLLVRNHYARIYRTYSEARQKIQKTEQPQWLPYERKDLRRVR
jgi:hypothetical protein